MKPKYFLYKGPGRLIVPTNSASNLRKMYPSQIEYDIVCSIWHFQKYLADMSDIVFYLVDKVGNSIAYVPLKLFYLIKENITETDTSPFHRDLNNTFKIMNKDDDIIGEIQIKITSFFNTKLSKVFQKISQENKTYSPQEIDEILNDDQKLQNLLGQPQSNLIPSSLQNAPKDKLYNPNQYDDLTNKSQEHEDQENLELKKKSHDSLNDDQIDNINDILNKQQNQPENYDRNYHQQKNLNDYDQQFQQNNNDKHYQPNKLSDIHEKPVDMNELLVNKNSQIKYDINKSLSPQKNNVIKEHNIQQVQNQSFSNLQSQNQSKFDYQQQNPTKDQEMKELLENKLDKLIDLGQQYLEKSLSPNKNKQDQPQQNKNQNTSQIIETPKLSLSPNKQNIKIPILRGYYDENSVEDEQINPHLQLQINQQIQDQQNKTEKKRSDLINQINEEKQQQKKLEVELLNQKEDQKLESERQKLYQEQERKNNLLYELVKNKNQIQIKIKDFQIQDKEYSERLLKQKEKRFFVEYQLPQSMSQDENKIIHLRSKINNTLLFNKIVNNDIIIKEPAFSNLLQDKIKFSLNTVQTDSQNSNIVMKIAEGELVIKDIFNNAHNKEINREIRNKLPLIIQVWEKCEPNQKLIGITKLNLQNIPNMVLNQSQTEFTKAWENPQKSYQLIHLFNEKLPCQDLKGNQEKGKLHVHLIFGNPKRINQYYQQDLQKFQADFQNLISNKNQKLLEQNQEKIGNEQSNLYNIHDIPQNQSSQQFQNPYEFGGYDLSKSEQTDYNIQELFIDVMEQIRKKQDKVSQKLKEFLDQNKLNDLIFDKNLSLKDLQRLNIGKLEKMDIEQFQQLLTDLGQPDVSFWESFMIIEIIKRQQNLEKAYPQHIIPFYALEKHFETESQNIQIPTIQENEKSKSEIMEQNDLDKSHTSQNQQNDQNNIQQNEIKNSIGEQKEDQEEKIVYLSHKFKINIRSIENLKLPDQFEYLDFFISYNFPNTEEIIKTKLIEYVLPQHNSDQLYRINQESSHTYTLQSTESLKTLIPIQADEDENVSEDLQANFKLKIKKGQKTLTIAESCLRNAQFIQLQERRTDIKKPFNNYQNIQLSFKMTHEFAEMIDSNIFDKTYKIQQDIQEIVGQLNLDLTYESHIIFEEQLDFIGQDAQIRKNIPKKGFLNFNLKLVPNEQLLDKFVDDPQLQQQFQQGFFLSLEFNPFHQNQYLNHIFPGKCSQPFYKSLENIYEYSDQYQISLNKEIISYFEQNKGLFVFKIHSPISRDVYILGKNDDQVLLQQILCDDEGLEGNINLVNPLSQELAGVLEYKIFYSKEPQISESKSDSIGSEFKNLPKLQQKIQNSTFEYKGLFQKKNKYSFVMIFFNEIISYIERENIFDQSGFIYFEYESNSGKKYVSHKSYLIDFTNDTKINLDNNYMLVDIEDLKDLEQFEVCVKIMNQNQSIHLGFLSIDLMKLVAIKKSVKSYQKQQYFTVFEDNQLKTHDSISPMKMRILLNVALFTFQNEQNYDSVKRFIEEQFLQKQQNQIILKDPENLEYQPSKFVEQLGKQIFNDDEMDQGIEYLHKMVQTTQLSPYLFQKKLNKIPNFEKENISERDLIGHIPFSGGIFKVRQIFQALSQVDQNNSGFLDLHITKQILGKYQLNEYASFFQISPQEICKNNQKLQVVRQVDYLQLVSYLVGQIVYQMNVLTQYIKFYLLIRSEQIDDSQILDTVDQHFNCLTQVLLEDEQNKQYLMTQLQKQQNFRLQIYIKNAFNLQSITGPEKFPNTFINFPQFNYSTEIQPRCQNPQYNEFFQSFSIQPKIAIVLFERIYSANKTLQDIPLGVGYIDIKKKIDHRKIQTNNLEITKNLENQFINIAQKNGQSFVKSEQFQNAFSQIEDTQNQVNSMKQKSYKNLVYQQKSNDQQQEHDSDVSDRRMVNSQEQSNNKQKKNPFENNLASQHYSSVGTNEIHKEQEQNENDNQNSFSFARNQNQNQTNKCPFQKVQKIQSQQVSQQDDQEIKLQDLADYNQNQNQSLIQKKKKKFSDELDEIQLQQSLAQEEIERIQNVMDNNENIAGKFDYLSSDSDEY
ncbi:C2 domain [Pseudocohnilembus persalinus]|uniref:C2 domain n=1 Tax=Pseudocohnilembus persalinus TaxID=266149 RepID=A0A0V0QMN3_PSEPJ|nr:C2 domain [Pseudocohnilembus persalinus]|eukprot:KRX03531.1 C2 domain [Pseudocohnilembus persalinus]